MFTIQKISVALLLGGFIFLSAHAQTQPFPPEKIGQVSKNVYVYTTYGKAGGVMYPANALYVVTRVGIVLIDTPWDAWYHKKVLDELEKRHGKKVIMCIATHFHDDRTAALQFLQQRGVQTWSSELTRALCKKYGKPQAAHTFQRDTVFTVGGTRIETFYPGAGHTRDNIVVWLPGRKVLYGGCFLKSAEAKNLGNIEDADVKAWPASLQRTRARFPGAIYVIPGHDNWRMKGAIGHSLELLEKAGG